MNLKLISFITLFMVAISCHDESHESVHEHEHEHSHEEHQSSFTLDDLKLNNGQKWEMDAHTRKMINSMVLAIKVSNKDSFSQMQSLGSALKSQLNKLISGCTMKGASHDQLHVILPPIQKTINQLVASKDLVSSQKELKELNYLLQRYQANFK